MKEKRDQRRRLPLQGAQWSTVERDSPTRREPAQPPPVLTGGARPGLRSNSGRGRAAADYPGATPTGRPVDGPRERLRQCGTHGLRRNRRSSPEPATARTRAPSRRVIPTRQRRTNARGTRESLEDTSISYKQQHGPGAASRKANPTVCGPRAKATRTHSTRQEESRAVFRDYGLFAPYRPAR